MAAEGVTVIKLTAEPRRGRTTMSLELFVSPGDETGDENARLG